MSFIYKIINLINNKIYIGYTSQNINARFSQHKSDSLNNRDNSILHKAIKKYGAENFKIEVIEEFDENKKEWQSLEKFYIKEFQSLIPNGYNILEGGDKPPAAYGDMNNKTKIKDNQMESLYNMLRDTKVSLKDIAKHFGVSSSQIERINKGTFRHQEGVEYPIRKFSKHEENALKVIEILKTNRSLTHAEIADMIPNYFKSNEISSINTGKKYGYLYDGEFPIQKYIVPRDYQEKQELAKKVIDYIKEKNFIGTQVELRKIFSATRVSIENILKGKYPFDLEECNYPIKLEKPKNKK